MVDVLTNFYQKQFTSREVEATGWFATLQREAFKNFQKLGFPNRNTEQWKYTSLDALKAYAFEQMLDVVAVEKGHSHVIRVTDSQIIVPSQLPEGVHVCSIQEALVKHEQLLQSLFSKQLAHDSGDSFTNLNLALLNSGVFVHIEKDTVIAEPLHIRIERAQAKHSQQLNNVYLVETGASLNLIEQFSGETEATYLTNQVSHIVAKPNAKVAFVKWVDESTSAYHISRTYVQQYRDSQVTCYGYALGGALVRSDVAVDLNEPGAANELIGLYLGADNQHRAHYTRVNHWSPHTISTELYKGVLADMSQGVFNGTVYVAPNAQKISASQQNNNLLLSQSAEVNTKPQLEIYADDVKCAHGATVGQLDENALFYLQSRGIDKAAATQLLVDAFAGDMFERLPEPFSTVKQALLAKLASTLGSPETNLLKEAHH